MKKYRTHIKLWKKTNHFVNGLLDLSGILFATNVIVESIPEHSRNSNSSGPIHGSRFDRNKYSTSIYEGRNLCALFSFTDDTDRRS